MSFERLQSADPAPEPDEVTMARLRRSVFRKRRVNPMSIAAGITAFALIAGGGVAVGRITAPTPSTMAATDSSLAITSEAPSRSGEAGMSADDASKSYLPWGGRVILNPSASMSDVAGVASGFTFTANGDLDLRAILKGLADLVGADGSVIEQDNTLIIGGVDGTKPNASIYQDPMRSFYAYNNELSPWNCVRQEDIDRYSEKDGYPGPDVRVCTDEDLAPASKDDAERAFARVLAVLGLSASDVTKTYVDTGSRQVVMVQGNAKVKGTETNLQQVAVSVSAKGLFNISGFAARPTEIEGYEIVGAKSAALRSLQSKWSSLGPNPFGDWGGVYPMEGSVMPTSRAFNVDGRPGLRAYIDTIDVSKSRLGLVSYYTEDATMLLPSWIYTAADGRQWSMIALAEKYVKFSS